MPQQQEKKHCSDSQGGYKRIGKMIEDSFAENNCELVFDYFNGECSTNEINRLLKVVRQRL